MQDFLNYLVNKIPNSGLTQSIDAAVERAKAKEEWRLEYMTLHMRDLEKIEEGRKEERIKTISLLESLSKEGKSIDEILEIFKNSISESPERENINS